MFRFALIALAAFLPATTALGATLTSAGIDDLNVGGTLYDVQFLDQSCNTHYDCTSGTGFDFDEDGAEAAIRAIGDLFLLPENTSFNEDPSLTDGCLLSTYCAFFVPFSYTADTNTFRSWTLTNRFPAFNLIGQSSYSTQFNGDQEVFAKFSLSNPDTPPGVIPLPAGGLLLLSGLGALSFARRRSHSKD